LLKKQEKIEERVRRLEQFNEGMSDRLGLPNNLSEKYDALVNMYKQSKEKGNEYNHVSWMYILYEYFQAMGGYKSSDELANECKIRYKYLHKKDLIRISFSFLGVMLFVIIPLLSGLKPQ
jgi:hypothetical protein